MAGNAEPGVIVDEEVEDAPGLIEAEDSSDPPEPTGTTPTAADGADPDPLAADSEDLEDELLPNERATAAPAAAAAPTAEKTPATPAATPAPFTYKGDKAEHTLEGAQYYAGDGLYIPDAQVPKLKQLLANAAVHNGSWQREKRNYERQLEAATKGRTEKDVAADALMDLVFKDLGTLKSDEDVYEWALNFRQNLPKYRNDIRERQLQHREQELEQRSQPDPEEVEASYESSATSEMSSTLDQIFARPEFKILDAEDQKELRTRFAGKAREFLYEADRDLPEYGYKKGQLVFDGAQVLDQIQAAARIKQRTVASAEAARAAAAANARKLGKPVPGAKPPAPAANSAATPSETPRDGQGRFKSKAEWQAYMDSDQ